MYLCRSDKQLGRTELGIATLRPYQNYKNVISNTKRQRKDYFPLDFLVVVEFFF